MKTKIFLFTVSLLLIFSCRKTDQYIIIKGKVLDEITKENVPGAKIWVRIVSTHIEGFFSYETLIDSKTTSTDDAGNFSIAMQYNDANNIVDLYKTNNEKYTELLDFGKNHTVSEFANNNAVVFYVRRWEKLKIKVKNLSPYDSNDNVRISILQQNTSLDNSIIDSIQNFGKANQPIPPPAYDDGKYPFWIGSNVNSIIYGKVQENTKLTFFWSVRKNGISKDYQSAPINTISNGITEFEINY